jgi:uncharacterized RDD family membrane protein YckC
LGVPSSLFASFGDRVPGFLLDILIIGGECIAALIVVSIVGYLLLVLAGSRSANTGPGAETLGIAMLLPVLYNKVYLVTRRGATVGQRVKKLRVIDARGNHLSLGRAFLRFLLEAGFGCIPFLPLIDLMWPISWWNSDPNLAQTLHDRIVGSYVAYAPDAD